MAYRTQPGEIRSALQSVLEGTGLGHLLLEKRLRESWVDFLGARAASLCDLESLRDGLLRIRVRDAVWRQELHFQKDALRKKANALLGGEAVKDIALG